MENDSNTSSLALLLIILGLTIVSAYFASTETAMMKLNPYRLKHLVRQKHRGARKSNKLLRRPDRLLGVILIGNNLVNNFAATVATLLGARLLGETGVVLAPILLTLHFLIFAEVAPKTVAAHRPETVAFPSSFILEPLLRILQPAVYIVNAISNLLVAPLIKRSREGNDELSIEELRTVVDSGANISRQRQEMLLGVLDLEKVTVEDIMVPRNDIAGINLNEEHEAIAADILNAQHTRLPVFKTQLNQVIGILHLRRTSRFLSLPREFNKAELMRETDEPYFIPEGTPLSTQLVNFQKHKERIALIVDEYGDVIGLLTLDDILEEIVGKFTTDYTSEIEEMHLQEDGSYYIKGSSLLREVNRTLEWELPTDGPRTVNGLILEHLEFIPESNVCFRVGPYAFETLQMSENVVKSVRIEKLDAKRFAFDTDIHHDLDDSEGIDD